LRKIDEDLVGISFNETTTIYDLDEVIEIFADLKEKRNHSNYLPAIYYENKQAKGMPKELSR
jgi:hypothetical protein